MDPRKVASISLYSITLAAELYVLAGAEDFCDWVNIIPTDKAVKFFKEHLK